MPQGTASAAEAADTLAFPDALRARETVLIARRRAKAGVAADAPLLGTAFSGGGIRSATFCLGFTQALAHARELRQIDYLSTASGGGYFAGFLGRLYARDYVGGPDKVEQMLDPLTPPLTGDVPPSDAAWRPNAFRWLRENGRYLAPNGAGDLLLALAVALRNWAAMHLLLASGVLALLLLLQLPILALPADGGFAAALPAADWLWWSPLVVLVPLAFNFVLLPLGWAYWLVAAREDADGQPVPGLIDWRQPKVAVLLFVLCWVAGQPGAGIDLLVVAALATLLAWQATSACRSAMPRECADQARDLLSRRLGKALLGLGLLLGLVLIDTLGRTWYALLTHTDSGLGAWFVAIGVALMAVVTRASALAETLARLTGHDASRGARLPVKALSLFAALVLGTGALALIDLAAQGFVWGFAPPGGVPAPLVGADAGGLLAGSQSHVGLLLVGLVGSAAIGWALGSRDSLGFLNRTSLDPLYSARLTRAYLGASNPLRHTDRTLEAVTEVAPGDDLGLDDYHRRGIFRGAPLHLINVTINETVDGRSQIQQQDRHGLGLALGPAGLSAGMRHHAVFVPNGDDERDDFEETTPMSHDKPQVQVFGPKVHDDTNDERLPVFAYAAPPAQIASVPVQPDTRLYTGEPLTLGHWLAISGAAFSTGRGQGTSFGVSLLSGFFNARLGRWWDSDVRRQQTWRDLPERLFGAHALLLREFLARFPGTARRHWFVSDGGHFENLALYELVRRRLPWLLALDAGCDRDFTFDDLGNFVRKARLDFGAEVRFLDAGAIQNAGLARYGIGPLEALRIRHDMPDATAQAHAALATIRYADDSRGVLLYVKATLAGELPVDVREYAGAHPDFPHEPTSDQFFDEAQWESYRRLGEHVGSTLLRPLLAAGETWTALDPQTPSRLRRLYTELEAAARAN